MVPLNVASVFFVALFAWYVSRISHQQAETFINYTPSPSSSPSVSSSTPAPAPGSGEFFNAIAGTYDTLNSFLSLGLHSRWRRRMLSYLPPSSSCPRVLDVATGTADVLVALSRLGDYELHGVDPSEGMLALGRQKIPSNATLLQASAESLPFDDASFGAATVAFGVRNFADRPKGLREIARVMQPKGTFLVLELSLPGVGSGLLNPVAKFVIGKLLVPVAGAFSGNVVAYKYLLNSMTAFPSRRGFEPMLRDAGFELQSHERLAPFGLGPDLYVATKMAVDDGGDEAEQVQ